MKNIKQKNANRVTIAQINVNSIRNKLDFLCEMIRGNIDILQITETKIDSSFPSAQFQIDGYTTPYRLDRDSNGGGILVYVREDIPSKVLENTGFGSEIEAMLVEITVRKVKWLISCSYNSHKAYIKKHLQDLGKNLDLQSSKCENFIIMVDFNAEPSEKTMSDFLDIYNLKNLVKNPACFKNPVRPSCRDLILTNKIKNFQPCVLLETGISDFHKMVVTVLKPYIKKKESRIIKYRNHTNFCNYSFRTQLLNELNKGLITISDLDHFNTTVLKILDDEAPIKMKNVRANDAPFMNRTIKKAIMKRSRLRNKFLKNPTDENNLNYKRQRNLCVTLLRNEKRIFFEHTDTKKNF